MGTEVDRGPPGEFGGEKGGAPADYQPAFRVATSLSVLAGATLVKSVMEQNNPMAGPGEFPRCPSCNESGRVSCFCSRWSEGDGGCRTCVGIGRMAE